MSRPLAWALLPILLIVLIGAAFLVSDPLRPFSAGRAAGRGAHGRAHRARRRGHRASGAGRRLGTGPDRAGAGRRRLLDLHAGPAGAAAAALDGVAAPSVPLGAGRDAPCRDAQPEPASPSSTRSTWRCRRRPAAAWGRSAWSASSSASCRWCSGCCSTRRSKAGGRTAFDFALALTVGLLLFLLVDTLQEALELAAEAAPGFHGGAMVWLVAALTAALLFAVGRRKGGRLEGVALATAIALGIGIHNFGEGLAIGSAFATGAAALGTFLVLGFTLHNITEGIGIVAPLVEKRPRLPVFVCPGRACRAAGGRGYLARELRLRAALGGVGFRGRRRRDPPGDRRGGAAPRAPQRAAGGQGSGNGTAAAAWWPGSSSCTRPRSSCSSSLYPAHRSFFGNVMRLRLAGRVEAPGPLWSARAILKYSHIG